jgi:hypothetical protein
MFIRKIAITAAVSGAAIVVTAAPALAHDCFNPQKDVHAPTGGVNYELSGFNPDGTPILQQVGPGQGIGGFIEIATGLFGNPVPLYTHSLGADSTNPNVANPHDAVGGPGSSSPAHACDQKGIDYFEACSTAP